MMNSRRGNGGAAQAESGHRKRLGLRDDTMEAAVDKLDFGLTFGNPDFVKYAEAYGARASRVTAAGDLVATIDAAFKGGGVHLIDVPIDYSENVRVLIDELKHRVKEIEVT